MDWLDREPTDRRRLEKATAAPKLTITRKDNPWQRISHAKNQSTHQHIPTRTAQSSPRTTYQSADRRSANQNASRSIDQSTKNRRAVNQRVQGAAGSLTAAPQASNRERPPDYSEGLGNHVEAPPQSRLRTSVPHSRYGNGNHLTMNKLQTDNSPHRILYSVGSTPLTLDHPRRFNDLIQSLVTAILIILIAGLLYGILLVLMLQTVAQ